MKRILTISMNSNYETKPDLLCNQRGKFLVYTETKDGEHQSVTTIKCMFYQEKLKKWKNIEFEYDKRGVPYWDKPRFLKNSASVSVFCTLIEKTGECGEIVYFELDDNNHWSKPMGTGIVGILSGNPIVLESGRVLLLEHRKDSTGYYTQYIHYTDDMEKWYKSKQQLSICHLNLSDSEIIQVGQHRLLMIIRESSATGWDLFKSMSEDNGETWSKPVRLPFRGGQNPSIAVYYDTLYIAFYKDYISNSKSVSLTKVSLTELILNHYKAEFETILEHDKSKGDILEAYGYGGIAVNKDQLLLGASYSKNQTTGYIYVDEIVEVRGVHNEE